MILSKAMSTDAYPRPPQSGKYTSSFEFSNDFPLFGKQALKKTATASENASFRLTAGQYFEGPVSAIGNGTVEWWVLSTGTIPTNQVFWSSGNFSAEVRVNARTGSPPGFSVRANYNTGTNETGISRYSFNTWTHVAITLEDNKFITFWMNGGRITTLGNGTDTFAFANPGLWQMGYTNDGLPYYMREFRVSTSVRYDRANATYPIPTGPFVNDADTYMLFHMDGTDENLSGIDQLMDDVTLPLSIIFVAGRSNGGTNDFSVTRVYDSNGAFIWRGQDMIEGRGITLTPNNEVITGGERNASTNTIQVRNQTTGALTNAYTELSTVIINTVAAAGNYYVKGRNGTVSNTTLKLDVATNSLIWAREHGAGINRVEIDSAENVWTAGLLDPGGISIRKYDAAGTLLLSFSQTNDSPPGGNVTFNSIKVDNAGFIHTASNKATGNIVKWNIDFAPGPGQIIWQQTHGATVRCITVDAAGNVYAAGDLSGGVTTRKYNSSGTLQWSVSHGATVRGITVDEYGNVYTTGDRISSVTTRKYDSSGNLVWSLDYGDTTYDITNTTQF